MSEMCLQRVAAHFNLCFDDVKAIAYGVLPLDDASQARLAQIQLDGTLQAESSPSSLSLPAQLTQQQPTLPLPRTSGSRGRRKKGTKKEDAVVDVATVASDIPVSGAAVADEMIMGGDAGDENGDAATLRRKQSNTEETQEDELVASMIQALSTEGTLSEVREMQVDPDCLREQEIVAEVARRRSKLQAKAATRQREKSDAIFDAFDQDKDGYMNYAELRALGTATGGSLTEIAYCAICEELGIDASRGVTKEELWRMYSSAGMGDASRDYNLVFNQ